MFSEIAWPYESSAETSCPECKHHAKVDGKVHWYWDDSMLELRCRKCFHQWTLRNVDWVLTGKQFVNGERVEPYPERTK